MNPNANGDHGTKSLNEWFDVNDELCCNPCYEAQLAQGTMMEAIDMNIPSDIIFVFENYSFDEAYSSELSSFQDSTTFGSSTQYPTGCGWRSGNTNTNTYYVVTPLSKEQSSLDKKSVQTEKEPVIKEVHVKGSANTYRDEGVELIYGSKAYLKKIGMRHQRQRFIPLRRIRTMMATSINQAIQLQGSGDSTKSLSSSDEESNEEENKKDDVAEKENDVTEWKAEAKKKLKAKKQSEKLLEKQMMNAQRKHEKDQKAEAKRAKREARKNKGHFCSALKNLHGKKKLDDFDVQRGISVQEVWRST